MSFIITGIVVVVICLAVHFLILAPKDRRKAVYEGGFSDGREWINFGEGNNLHVWFTPSLYHPAFRDLYEKGFYAGVEDCKLAEEREGELVRKRMVESNDFVSTHHI